MVPAPEDVRIQYPDGTEVPLELVYVNTDGDGIHHWKPTRPVDYLRGMTITMAVLPAKTAIDIVSPST
jgi:hypothetical protein